MHSFVRYAPIPIVILFLAAVGCSDGPKVVPVTGVLKFKGKPVTNAYIEFIPASGRPSWGQTDSEGRFKLNYTREQDGAVVGKHKVYVRRRSATAAEQEAEMTGKPMPLSKEGAELFDKYGQDKSKVEVEITKNTKELQLNWD